jgi:tryptophan-rich sensory protein
MYQPYPSAGQAPEPVRRDPPDSVLTAVKLMYAGAVVSGLSLVVGLVTIGSLRSALRKAYPNVTASQLHTIEVATVVFIVIFGLIGIGLWIWMAMANKRGGNWARITATVFFGLNTVSLLVGLARPEPLASRLVGLLIWLIGLGAVVMLWRSESTAFFKAPRY